MGFNIGHKTNIGKHTNWKTGRYEDKRGYIRIWVDFNKYQYEHIIIMEKHLARRLEPNELVHHKNGNKSDNRLENLELTTRSTHPRIHQTGRTRPVDLVVRIRQSFLDTITKRMSGVTCSVCETPYTEIGMRANWRKIADGYMCRKCDKTIFESNLRQVGYYKLKHSDM